MRKTIKLEGIGKEIVLANANGGKIKSVVFHLDKWPVTDEWVLTYNSNMIPDIMKLKSIDFSNLADTNGHAESDEKSTIVWRGLGISSTVNRVVPQKDTNSKFRIIHLDYIQTADAWNLLYSPSIIPNISELSRLVMGRKD